MKTEEMLKDMKEHTCHGRPLSIDDPRWGLFGWECRYCGKRWVFDCTKFREDVPQYFEMARTTRQRILFPMVLRGLIPVDDEEEV